MKHTENTGGDPKRAEKRKTEEQSLLENYRMLVENIGDWIWEVDANAVYTYASPKVKDLLGYEPEEIIGKTPFDFMTPDEAERVAGIFSSIASGRKPFFLLENKNIHKDGREVILETSGVPVFDAKGALAGYRGIDRDITEHRRYNSILSAIIKGTSSTTGVDFFRSLVRHLAAALNVDFILLGELSETKMNVVKTAAVWAKSNWADNFEYDLAGTPCNNVVGKDVCTYIKGVQELFPEDLILRDMGIESYAGVPLYAADGSPLGVLVALDSKPISDASLVESVLSIFASRAALELERRKYEEELKLYAEIINHMTEGTALVRSGDGTIISASPGFYNLFGYDEGQLIGLNMEVLYAPGVDAASPEGLHAEISDVLEKDRMWKGEFRYVRSDSTIFWCAVNVTKFRPSKYGEVWLVVMHDITDKKVAEEQMARAQKLESLGILAGGIAHDFNNILTGIIGNLSLVERVGMQDLDYCSKKLKVVLKAANQAQRLTQQLLTFSKGGSPVMEPVSVVKLLEEACGFSLRGSNVACDCALPDGLPAVEGDEGQLNQVVNNLLINAVQAMPQGGTINVSAKEKFVGAKNRLGLKEGPYVEVTIEDNGIGISSENLSNVFDPYFTTKQTGSGLGLAVAYSVVKNHGGGMDVESEPGVGTRFYVYLPVSSKRAAIEALTPDTGASKSHVGKKVLVMDDEEIIRDVANEILSHLGYSVVTAVDGAEAVELYKGAASAKERFALVIMDLTVPGGVGGLEATRRILEIDPSARIIVSSGYSNDRIMSEFREHGFCGVVVKPYTASELGAKVFRAIAESD